MKTQKLSMVLSTSLIHKNFQCDRKLNAILACVKAYLYGKNIEKGVQFDRPSLPGISSESYLEAQRWANGSLKVLSQTVIVSC